jgi:hypothetical protein
MSSLYTAPSQLAQRPTTERRFPQGGKRLTFSYFVCPLNHL